MDLVVSDSSVLIHLASIGRLILLKELYEHVTITPAVWKEVVEQGGSRAGAAEVTSAHQAGWIGVAALADQSLIRLLRRELEDGESETIALAIERQAALTLLDEAEARRIAEVYGLRKTGIVGILIRAKREGRIESLRTELDSLRTPLAVKSWASFWRSSQPAVPSPTNR